MMAAMGESATVSVSIVWFETCSVFWAGEFDVVPQISYKLQSRNC
jgi:hypothetical protein